MERVVADVVGLLLEAKPNADPNAKDDDGNTALCYAVKKRNGMRPGPYPAPVPPGLVLFSTRTLTRTLTVNTDFPVASAMASRYLVPPAPHLPDAECTAAQATVLSPDQPSYHPNPTSDDTITSPASDVSI